MGKVIRQVTDSRSITATVNLDSVELYKCSEYSVQLNITNSSSADIEFKVQVSNDNTNFVDLTDSELAITADVIHLLEVVAVSYKFMRVTFTRTSGSFTAETIVSIKE